MLLELSIKNIALIEQLRVAFSPGLNVLTGETGAGKSIVVDSVNLALGGRTNRDLIRTGAETASVQALFDVSQNAKLGALLSEMGLQPEDGLLSLGRELSASGRTLCRVQGEVLPLAKFRALTALLVDVHGQHEHQSLLDVALHREYLDAYGDAAHAELIERVGAEYEQFSALGREIERLGMNALERERKIDMLNFQIDEIEAVKPKPGEDAKLEQKNNLYKNAEKIAGALSQAYAAVYKGDGRHSAAQESLKRAEAAMRQIAPIDERFLKLADRLEELYYAVQDAGYELGDMQGEVEYDPLQSERIDDRLSELKRLKRKYGPELSDVLAFLVAAQDELAQLGSGDERIAQLKAQRKQLEAALINDCGALSESRKRLAKGFEAALIAQLSGLGMAKTRFEVRFDESLSTVQRLGPTGVDRIEFVISPNPGEPLKPLHTIASGGELARIMLAMKAIAADTAGVDTMIFDEIDTGVSGHMAQVVGEKLAEVAQRRQVICVTHLPQIAALGQAHYVVEKSVVEGRTGSSVRKLDEPGRVDELARLLSGAGDIEGGRQYAQAMLQAAQALLQRTQIGT